VDHSSNLTQIKVLAPCLNVHSAVDCEHCKVRALSVCAALEADELAELNRYAHPFCLSAKQNLFAQEEESTSVYNITDGAVRLYKILPDGRRQIIGFALPGDFLGLSMAERNAFSADTLTTVSACQFSRIEFSNLVDKKPQLLRRLHNLASHELSLAQDQMVILGRRTAEEKIAAFLMGLRKRWGRGSDHLSVLVPLPMTRQDIGDFLGLTVETVSRLMTKLAREKVLVIVPDGVRLLNMDRLEKLAET
jgi:CRP/FNR family transcriptional regulator